MSVGFPVIPVIYRNDAARFDFFHDVSPESIFSLCTQLDHAVSYYQYRRVEIAIQSPGGSVRALKLFQEHLAAWRADGIQIATRGVAEVGSAAAVMLSLGDLGTRSAGPHATLLYHHVRVSGEALADQLRQRSQTGLTSDGGDSLQSDLRALSKQLKLEDQIVFGALFRHLFGGGTAGLSGAETWFGRMFDQRMGALRTDILPEARARSLDHPAFVTPSALDAVQKCLGRIAAGLDKGMAPDAVIRDEIGRIARADRCVHPLLAYALFLIDEVPGVTND